MNRIKELKVENLFEIPLLFELGECIVLSNVHVYR